MAHCTFRLSITPERAPDVRRVVDFDGRNSLHDVHWMIQETFELDADHLYAFYLSGKYFDTQSEYGEGSSRPADTALLFRLGLRQGQSFAYLFDFGDELRHTVTVLSVTDVQAPLTEPLLVESIGEAPRQYEYDEDDESDEGQESEEDEVVSPKVARLEPQVRRFLELYAVLEPRRGAKADAATVHELAQAALELGQRLEGDIGTFAELDGCFSEDDLALRLLELPERLSLAGDTESALAVARAFTFLAPDQLRGELSVIYARAGRRAEAEAQIAANLASVENASIAEGKAGEAYLALGEPASAEAYYQRALVEAIHPRDRELALARLATFLLESGRESEAQAFLKQLNRPARAPAAVSTARLGVPAVGRNEPCPCGSGKKYKKCHGAPVG